MSDFKEKYSQLVNDFEQALSLCFDEHFDAPDNIVSAMKYSLFAGGKRLRPVMMIETCRVFGGDVQKVMRFACAMEMIHTSSLIHDDLPAMDNDDLRRGKPTNHVVYGEDIAILAGDALLIYAMETITHGAMPSDYRDLAAMFRATNVMFRAAGVNGMIGGQTGDLLCESLDEVTTAHLEYVHQHKTGALFNASVLCGGIIGGADDAELEALKAFSTAFGIAFQIVDDILDVVGEEKSLGKPIGSDERNHKTTFVTLYGLTSSREKVMELNREAKEALAKIHHDTTFLEEMTDYICDRVC